MEWIVKMLRDRKAVRGCEVGAATGDITVQLLRRVRTLKTLIVVDTWQPDITHPVFNITNMEQVFRERIKGDDRVRIIKGDSFDMAALLPDKSLDFVILDANTAFMDVCGDLQEWIPKVKDGGLLCGFRAEQIGINLALREFFGVGGVVKGLFGIWYIEKNKTWGEI